ncbi:MAG TPA: hypothetical protein GX716_00635 [Firmicutes bacterium]|nr:hypothetical protein [Candidatus Fermentithermobacillaceae bacterium]
MDAEPFAVVLLGRLLMTLAVGRLCQIVLKGLKVHEIGDLCWFLALCMCITTGLALVKEVVSGITSYLEPVFVFLEWFNNEPEAKKSWWEWLTTYPKGGR